jgi:hypothetical protein
LKAIKDMHAYVEDNFKIVDRQAKTYLEHHGTDAPMKE